MIYIIIDYDRWTNGIKMQAGQSLKISRDSARVQNKQCKPHTKEKTMRVWTLQYMIGPLYKIYNELMDPLISTWQYCIYCYMINDETLCDESSKAQNINSLRKDKIMLYPGHIQSQSLVQIFFFISNIKQMNYC